MVDANAAIVDPVVEKVFPKRIVPRPLIKVPERIDVSGLDTFTKSITGFRLKKGIVLSIFWTEAIDIFGDDVKVSSHDCRDRLFL